jgi:hypothetical protein
MICAGEFFTSELEVMKVEEIPHPELLKPTIEHPAQQLFSGMLLDHHTVHM